jgi:hypothetical protein
MAKNFLSFLLSVIVLQAAAQSKHVSVKIIDIKDYGKYEQFAYESAAKLEAALNSKEFEDRVKGQHYFFNKGKTPSQLYDIIMAAHEPTEPNGKDGVVELRVRTVTAADNDGEWLKSCEPGSADRTQGLDGSGTGVMAVCPQWLEIWATKKEYSSLASHYAHEYMHILGFRHPIFKSKTVPYKIQAIIDDLVDDK